MVQLDISQEESKILIDALENYVSELRVEITHTDQMDFREQLKKRKEVIGKVVDQLQNKAQT